jgi:hypothetical protein
MQDARCTSYTTSTFFQSGTGRDFGNMPSSLVEKDMAKTIDRETRDVVQYCEADSNGLTGDQLLGALTSILSFDPTEREPARGESIILVDDYD